jgi:prepilin-type N-terminal cleavage/methylation domain-containing protein
MKHESNRMDVMQGLFWTCHPRENGGPESYVALMDSRLRGNDGPRPTGFTLLEVLAALAILALASSSVLVVIDRCLVSASDSALRMEAFELVRENLEKILILDAVDETVDFGTSEKYPGISWQTVVEGFPEPTTGQMWVRAVCLADYMDSKGETQKIELVHWLMQLTDQQAGQLINQQDLEKLEIEQTMKTDEDAAAYANVDTDTLRKWVQDGLVKTQDNAFLRCNLDIFIQNKGNPTPEQKAEQVKSVQELARKLRIQQKELEQNAALGMPPGAGEKGGAAGPSNEAIKKMNAGQIKDLVNRKQR